MPSAKHSSTLDKAMGLISSIFNVALAQDTPFRPLQYYAHIMDLPLSSFVLFHCEKSSE